MRPKGLVETKLNKKVRRIEETVKLWESRLENIENEHKSTLSNYTEKIRRLEVRYKNLKRRFKSSEARVKDLAAKLSLSTSSCDSEEAGEFQEGFENHEEIGTENVVIDPKAHQDGSSSFEEDAVVKRRKRDKPSRVKNSEDDPGWHLSEKVLRMSDAINVTFPPTTKNFQDECGEPVILLQAVKIPDPMVDLGSNIDAESATESSFKCHFCQKSKKSMFKLIVHLRKHTGCEPPILNSERMEKSQRGELDRSIRSCTVCEQEFYVKKYSKHNIPDFKCSQCRAVTLVQEPNEGSIPVQNETLPTSPEAENNSCRKSPDKTTPSKGSTVHKCQTCRKNLASASSLRRHTLIHLKEKKIIERRVNIAKKDNVAPVNPVDRSVKRFICSLCNGDFKTWSDLEEHVTDHSEASGVEKRLPPLARGRPSIKQICCLKCHKKFPSKAEQVKHFAISHAWLKYKPYKCLICRKAFSTQDTLKTHKRRKHK